ncbi:MAG: long-chain fatty acid--CoA ligase [Acidobacteriia bacterium]|nr:long-chain fatty acid--CoA ligase [Terriglobia bacterium]
MEAPWVRFRDEGVPNSIEYPNETLPDLLDRAAERYADHVALKFFVDAKLPSSTVTYRQLQDRTRRFATALFQLGVRKGDRVAIMLPNCPEFVVAFFGALRLGAIAVSTNPLYVSREMREQFEDSGSETVVLLDQFFPKLREIQAATRLRRVIVADIAGTLSWPVRTLVHLVQRKRGEYVRIHRQSDIYHFSRLLAKYPPSPPGASLRPTDTAVFQYTGGTTGIPKAAMLTHGNLQANTLQLESLFVGVEPGKEVFMAAIPFFHVYGMTTCMLLGVHLGAEVAMVPRPRPVDLVMQVVQKRRVTVFPGVPTLYTAINNHPRVKDFDLRSVKFCVSGAAPLPGDVQKTFEKLTGGKLVEGYGLTEAAPVTHANPLYGIRKTGSVGIPLPDVDARIVGLETREPLPPNTDGELAIRGPQVMTGYWNRPEETALTLADGWLLTGDVARMDEDGFFYIVDRKKEMIDASGFKVLPREVEEVLLMHPKVQEAVAAGVPDPYRGESVKAWLVLKSGERANAEEIVAFCRLHLASFKVPRQVEFRTELPKTMVGKYLRRVLVEEEKAKLAGRVEHETR